MRWFLVLSLAVLGACAFDQDGFDPFVEPDPTGDPGDVDPNPTTRPTGAEGVRITDDLPDDQWPYTAEERAGMLQVANTASFEELDDDARLDRRAARNIVDARNGPDLELGTDDDAPFTELAELDQISYVGATAFDKLLAYAYEIGAILGDE